VDAAGHFDGSRSPAAAPSRLGGEADAQNIKATGLPVLTEAGLRRRRVAGMHVGEATISGGEVLYGP
jgi:hypothetical protein